MDKLLADLEAATVGSRGHDRAIDLLLNPGAEVWSPEWYSGADNDYLRWPDPKPGVAKYRRIKFYSTSLDAALTLVPEGWGIGQLWEAVEPKDRPWWGAAIRRYKPYRVVQTLASPTLPLALCIAALKARRDG